MKFFKSRLTTWILLFLFGISLGAYVALSRRQTKTFSPTGSAAAPEIIGIESWIGSDPLTLSQLREEGKVVLLDFWTYSCINCQRTLPYLRSWYDKYQDKGFVIVGVHSPEFNFEKNRDNVIAAMEKYNVNWPVAQDNDFATWRAYSNNYWPSKYLIDKDGKIRYQHFGEGAYEDTEKMIQTLLAEAGTATDMEVTPETGTDVAAVLRRPTREIYVGFGRGYLANPEGYQPNRVVDYTDTESYKDGFVYAQGSWLNSSENLEHARESEPLDDYLVIEYSAKTVNVVMETTATDTEARKVYVTLDGQPLTAANKGSAVEIDADGRSFVTVTDSDLYKVISSDGFETHTLKLSPVGEGLRFFAYTFGN